MFIKTERSSGLQLLQKQQQHEQQQQQHEKRSSWHQRILIWLKCLKSLFQSGREKIVSLCTKDKLLKHFEYSVSHGKMCWLVGNSCTSVHYTKKEWKFSSEWWVQKENFLSFCFIFLLRRVAFQLEHFQILMTTRIQKSFQENDLMRIKWRNGTNSVLLSPLNEIKRFMSAILCVWVR